MFASLILFTFVTLQSKPSQAEIDRAIDSGADYLKKQQAADGSWTMGPEDLPMHAFKSHMGRQSLGHTGLVLLALLHAGVNPEDDAIKRGFKFLSDQRDEFGHTYNCGLVLMAIEALAEKKMKGGMDRIASFRKIPADIRRLADELSKRLALGQNSEGSWTYAARSGTLGSTGIEGKQVPREKPGDEPSEFEPPPIGGDYSNTQYALLGLRAAAEMGIKIDPDIWFKAIECMLARQEKSGPKVKGFDVPAAGDSMWQGKKGPAHPRGTDLKTRRDDFEARGWGYTLEMSRPEAYGAVTAIGITSLVLCKYYLRGHKRFSGEIVDRVNRAIEDGCAWMAAKFNVADNSRWKDPMVPYENRAPNIDGYSMYGIERAGILGGLTHFGEHEWYGPGARVLIDRQEKDGRWRSEMFYEPKPTISTCFAILFLKRATEPVIPTENSKAPK